ncbi:hypothetical protein PIB30_014309 [Stylosanthes scabra]|uniref:Uncharacterized protein n=1 Tax=Stylosanthes scabra TaxID=79078 RepID=A0ABU6Q7L3_9FABA|nr:hypothetical protein [Stylosanthes scabra]
MGEVLIQATEFEMATKNSGHYTDLDDTDLEDEDYNPEASEEELSKEPLDKLSEKEEVGRSGKETRHKDRDVWKVHVIDNEVERPENITAKQIFSLPAGRKVELPFDALLRPIGDASASLSTVLESMASDFSLFSPLV